VGEVADELVREYHASLRSGRASARLRVRARVRVRVG